MCIRYFLYLPPMSLFLFIQKCGFLAPTYLPFCPMSPFLLFFFEVFPKCKCLWNQSFLSKLFLFLQNQSQLQCAFAATTIVNIYFRNKYFDLTSKTKPQNKTMRQWQRKEIKNFTSRSKLNFYFKVIWHPGNLFTKVI